MSLSGRDLSAEEEGEQRVADAVRGERWAVVCHLRKCATATHKHASAMRADAGTQAEPEARGVERTALALEAAAATIEAGGHWQ
jgi:hypothetical protein